RALDHKINSRACRRAVGAIQRHLLTNYRSEVAVEREQELLDIAPRPVGVDQREAGVKQRSKYNRGEEAEHRVHRTVMHEAEAADLIARRAAVGREEKVHLRVAEHADLRILVAQVRNLHDLGDALEARMAARAEESL